LKIPGPGTASRKPWAAGRLLLFSARLTGAHQTSKADELINQTPNIVFRWWLFLYLATFTHGLLAQPVYPAEPIVGPVYYVAPYGDDSRSKAQAASPSTPWRTVQKAADNAVAGDTIVVENGTYTSSGEDVLYFGGKSGTASKPIRFVSRNRWGAILDGRNIVPNVVRFRNANHIIIEGFEIKNGRARGVRSDNSTTSPQIVGAITIRQNWVHHNGRSDLCDPNTGSGGMGVLLNIYSRYWIFDKNLINTNGHINSDGSCGATFNHQHGLYLKGHGHTIKNNIIFDHRVGFNIKLDGPGDTLDPPINERSYIVINNTLAHTPVSGQPYRSITFYRNSGYNPRNVLIANNVFWGSTKSGEFAIQVGGGGWPWTGVEVVNNVADADNLVRPDVGTTAYRSALLVDENNVDNTTNPGIRGTTLGMASPKL
jgi:hypothetical protein